jgi:UPF0176 protein
VILKVRSGYEFFACEGREAKRKLLMSELAAYQIKGSIYLAPEGVNLSLSGPGNSLSQFWEKLEGALGHKIGFHEMEVEGEPFSRCLVKLRKELLAFKNLLPSRAPYIQSEDFRDEVRKLKAGDPDAPIILDIRKNMETQFGKFFGAQVLPMENFEEFPEFVKKLPEDWKQRKILTYCTGGIRCEKAAGYLKDQGFENVRQLKGGILGYFKETGGEGWEGSCFVFDYRVSVKPDLHTDSSIICRQCGQPYRRNSGPVLKEDLDRRCSSCRLSEANVPAKSSFLG